MAVRKKRGSRLGKAIEYLLIAGWFGLIFYGLPQGWGLLVAILGAPVLYLIAGILAWLFNVPAPELPSDTGGGVSVEEDDDWVTNPAYCHLPGNTFHHICNDDK